jgi:hypothetical protein
MRTKNNKYYYSQKKNTIEEIKVKSSDNNKKGFSEVRTTTEVRTIYKREELSEPKDKFDNLYFEQQKEVIGRILDALKKVWHESSGADLKLIEEKFNLDEIELRYIAIDLIDILSAYESGVSISTSLSDELKEVALEKLEKIELTNDMMR